MYEFIYDSFENEYDNNSRLLFTDTDDLMYGKKLEISMKMVAVIKKCLMSVIIKLNQNTKTIQKNQSLTK